MHAKDNRSLGDGPAKTREGRMHDSLLVVVPRELVLEKLGKTDTHVRRVHKQVLGKEKYGLVARPESSKGVG